MLEVSRGVECRVERFPLGVVASITPFNFPNMVPNWTIPNAIALGNCMILKPSRAGAAQRRPHRRAAARGGAARRACSRSCTADRRRSRRSAIIPDIDGDQLRRLDEGREDRLPPRRRRTSSAVLALGGAKNHLIVMPDADREMTATNVVASMSGCAGQRCMAASVMVAVSKTDHIIERMVERRASDGAGQGHRPGDLRARRRSGSRRYIDEAEAAGAKVLVDGRGATVPGKENGYYIGPTIIDHVTPDMRIAQEEVFGPVLVIVRAKDVDEALDVRERVAVRQRGVGVHRERRRGALRDGARERGHGRRERRRAGAARAVLASAAGTIRSSASATSPAAARSSSGRRSKKMTTKWNKEAGVNWMS